MDKSGRIVIPRALRNRLGLAPGADVHIEVEGSGLRIEPVAGTTLEEKKGYLVIPKSATRIDSALVQKMIDADRDMRYEAQIRFL